MPQPPLSGGAATLQYIASHRPVYITELVSFVGLSLPAMVVFLALYAALKHLNKSYAALGAIIGIASKVIALYLVCRGWLETLQAGLRIEERPLTVVLYRVDEMKSIRDEK